jgi:hypothetical protein
MPIKPDSRFAGLPVHQVIAPDGSLRQVIGLKLEHLPVQGIATRLRLSGGEGLDLLAHRLYGDESLWSRILDANPLVYPLDILPGDVLNVPQAGPATRITRARRF